VPVFIMKTCRGSGDTAPLRAGVNVGRAGCKILGGAGTQTQPQRRKKEKT
jgi:hypothetical protein